MGNGSLLLQRTFSGEDVTIVFLLLLPLVALCSIVFWSIRNGISPTPTSRKQKEVLLRAITANPAGPVYDLGSGWGTLAIALAKRFPDCKIIGIENSPIPYIASRVVHFFYGFQNLRFKRANFMNVSFEDAAVIVCYLFPGGMRKLKPKLEMLQPGTIVISNTFSVPGWKPEQTFHAKDLYRSAVYVYCIGKESEGNRQG
jgi:trans-aconitate methyltransferase